MFGVRSFKNGATPLHDKHNEKCDRRVKQAFGPDAQLADEIPRCWVAGRGSAFEASFETLDAGLPTAVDRLSGMRYRREGIHVGSAFTVQAGISNAYMT